MILRRFRGSLEPLRSQPDYGEDGSGNPFARTAADGSTTSKGCLMAVCEGYNDLIRECGEQIPPQNRVLDEDYTDDGISDHAHVTIQYGVCEDAGNVREWCEKNAAPFTFRITGAHVFKNEGSWVLVMRCNDDNLKQLHKDFCRDIPHVDGEFPDYNPHMTICYMKPDTDFNEAVKFCNERLAGKEVEVKFLEYSDDDDKLTRIELDGKDYKED